MNWQEALRATLDEFNGKACVSGAHDCMQFVSRYVYHRTGVEHADKYAYDSAESGDALMAAHGGIDGLITECLGEPKPTADLGDVVFCHVEWHELPGVYVGPYVWSFVHAEGKGLARLPSGSILKAWSV